MDYCSVMMIQRLKPDDFPMIVTFYNSAFPIHNEHQRQKCMRKSSFTDKTRIKNNNEGKNQLNDHTVVSFTKRSNHVKFKKYTKNAKKTKLTYRKFSKYRKSCWKLYLRLKTTVRCRPQFHQAKKIKKKIVTGTIPNRSLDNSKRIFQLVFLP